jgi:hypothetical protein
MTRPLHLLCCTSFISSWLQQAPKLWCWHFRKCTLICHDVITICTVSYNVLHFSVVKWREVNLWSTVSQPVRLGVRHPSGTRDQFFFLLEISFRQLRGCYFEAPCLTRGRVCNLLYNCFWALPEQSLLGQSPTELCHILLSHLRLPKRCSVVVKILCYKPEGRGFDSRWGEFFKFT